MRGIVELNYFFGRKFAGAIILGRVLRYDNCYDKR